MKKDIGWKSFFESNHRYADVINGIGCEGRQFVKDTDLQEVDSAYKGKARDLLRKTAFGVNFALVGIESQETVDYKFPLRNLHYEVDQYEKQAAGIRKEIKGKKTALTAGEYLYGFGKDSRLYPVVTFVIYSGKEPWDGPMSLHDIIDFSDIPQELQNKISNFSINLVDVRRLDDTSIFQTDVKYVFDFIRCAENKEKLYELVQNEPYYREMDEEAYNIVSLYTNSLELAKIEAEKGKEGKRDVCQAIKELIEDGRQEGIKEGIKEGIDKINLLNQKLIAQNRMEDMKRAMIDHEFQNKLLEELVNNKRKG